MVYYHMQVRDSTSMQSAQRLSPKFYNYDIELRRLAGAIESVKCHENTKEKRSAV